MLYPLIQIKIMKSNKEYRFKNNPIEKVFHDKFLEKFVNGNKDLSAIVFGWSNVHQTTPIKLLTTEQEDICINLIQWLGSHVGQVFLEDCKQRKENL